MLNFKFKMCEQVKKRFCARSLSLKSAQRTENPHNVHFWSSGAKISVGRGTPEALVQLRRCLRPLSKYENYLAKL
jgi:hypothetical protein